MSKDTRPVSKSHEKRGSAAPLKYLSARDWAALSTSMRILFCCQTYLNRELGAAKVVIELAEEMERLGWQCEVISRYDIAPESTGNVDYHSHFRRYLAAHAGKYDVVDYDHHNLPFPRRGFPERTLFVARSVLLWRHFANIELPREQGFKSRLRRLFAGRSEARKRDRRDWSARATVSEADLINVANDEDQAALLGIGITREKIVVIPYGLSRANRALFAAVSSAPPPNPKVAFVGTFDSRKGSVEFPQIVAAVCDSVPGATFRLLGTGADTERVLARFPARLRSAIEVFPKYSPAELPGLLAPCAVGVFPSYIEGFGFGVLEMLAASIPVIAYNSPGPPMMLPPEYLVPAGDTNTMSEKVAALLRDRGRLEAARVWAQSRAGEFSWARIARQTSDIYRERWQARQIKLSA